MRELVTLDKFKLFVSPLIQLDPLVQMYFFHEDDSRRIFPPKTYFCSEFNPGNLSRIIRLIIPFKIRGIDFEEYIIRTGTAVFFGYSYPEDWRDKDGVRGYTLPDLIEAAQKGFFLEAEFYIPLIKERILNRRFNLA